MKTNTTPVVEMIDIHKSYYLTNGEEVPVLHGVDLRIMPHEFVAIMGESGGGKSTLMNIMGCLHAPTKGQYLLEGEEISIAKDDYTLAFIRNQKMGFIFQQFNLLPKLSAIKNVALPGVYAGKNATERDHRAKELLRSVGLEDRIYHKPTELSGGQQQRVSIARSLMNDPEIILADEPTGALDSETGKEILELFSQFKKKEKTVIVITHDPKVAQYADRIIFMKDGKVVSHNYAIS